MRVQISHRGQPRSCVARRFSRQFCCRVWKFDGSIDSQGTPGTAQSVPDDPRRMLDGTTAYNAPGRGFESRRLHGKLWGRSSVVERERLINFRRRGSTGIGNSQPTASTSDSRSRANDGGTTSNFKIAGSIPALRSAPQGDCAGSSAVEHETLFHQTSCRPRPAGRIGFGVEHTARGRPRQSLIAGTRPPLPRRHLRPSIFQRHRAIKH